MVKNSAKDVKVKDKKRMTISFSIKVHEWLADRSRCSNRSINGEVNQIIKEEKKRDEEKKQ